MASTPARLPPVAAIDASRWVAEWTEHGGLYFEDGSQLHLRRGVRWTCIRPSACLACGTNCCGLAAAQRSPTRWSVDRTAT